MRGGEASTMEEKDEERIMGKEWKKVINEKVY